MDTTQKDHQPEEVEATESTLRRCYVQIKNERGYPIDVTYVSHKNGGIGDWERRPGRLENDQAYPEFVVTMYETGMFSNHDYWYVEWNDYDNHRYRNDTNFYCDPAAADEDLVVFLVIGGDLRIETPRSTRCADSWHTRS